MKIGLIGDYTETVQAHRAIPVALSLAADTASVDQQHEWLHTETLSDATLSEYSALWCVPASPYRDTENVLEAIKFARENNVPFLGTCGGYQHAALEYARNVLGYTQAENAEINPDTEMPLISALVCKLHDEQASIQLTDTSMISRIYQSHSISEEYFCGFGVNRDYLSIFTAAGMQFTGFDIDGDPRALEIPAHRFFIGTAFQPERSASTGKPHPLIVAFVAAAEHTES